MHKVPLLQLIPPETKYVLWFTLYFKEKYFALETIQYSYIKNYFYRKKTFFPLFKYLKNVFWDFLAFNFPEFFKRKEKLFSTKG